MVSVMIEIIDREMYNNEYPDGFEFSNQPHHEQLGSLAILAVVNEEFKDYVESSQVPDYIPDELLLEHEQEPSRADLIASLPHKGFSPEQQQETDAVIDAIGFPLDKIERLAHEPNKKDTEDVLGSFGVGRKNRGELIIYDLNEQQPPEQRFKTHVHKIVHSVSPLDPSNAEIYGGEEKRLEAEEFAKQLAVQSLVTKTYINGYHKKLAEMLNEGKITLEHFTEEAHAIALEYGVTNPAKLEQIQKVQLERIAEIEKSGPLPEGVRPTHLVSYEGPDGEMVLAGADKSLVDLTQSVTNHKELGDHRQSLKERFYSQEGLARSRERQKPVGETIYYRTQIIGKTAVRPMYEANSE